MCFVQAGNSSSSNTSDLGRLGSPIGRTALPGHGSGSPKAAGAIEPPANSSDRQGWRLRKCTKQVGGPCPRSSVRSSAVWPRRLQVRVMPSVRVGFFPTLTQLTGGSGHPEPLEAALPLIADAPVDHLCVGDHVSFFVGAGSDGLITASTLLAAQARLPVYVALYLLPLRHPVPVARQLATLAQVAPGRLTLGVGIGGEDRHEIEVCGVDPHTRGCRMDESLEILRALADGSPVSFSGEHFSLKEAIVSPPPSPRVPLIVGGRSDAAMHRAAQFGDGWLGNLGLPPAIQRRLRSHRHGRRPIRPTCRRLRARPQRLVRVCAEA